MGEANELMSALNRHGTVVLEGHSSSEDPLLSAAELQTRALSDQRKVDGLVPPDRQRRGDAALDDLRLYADTAFEALELQDPSYLFHIPLGDTAGSSVKGGTNLLAVHGSLEDVLGVDETHSVLDPVLVSSVMREAAWDGTSELQGCDDAPSGTAGKALAWCSQQSARINRTSCGRNQKCMVENACFLHMICVATFLK